MADCVWSEDFDGNWWTACNHGFEFTDGGPTENGMRFCCYCGRDLRAEFYSEDTGEVLRERPIDPDEQQRTLRL